MLCRSGFGAYGHSRLDSEEGGKTGVFGANGGWLIRGMLVCANISSVFVSPSPSPFRSSWRGCMMDRKGVHSISLC